jgi:putative tricarboxylic transport membrane protein
MKKEKTQEQVPEHVQYRRANFMVVCIMFALFVLVFILSFGLGPTTSRVSKVVCLIGMVLCILEIIVQLNGYKSPEVDKDEVLPKPQLIKWYYLFILLVLLYVSMNVLGFAVSSFLFLTFCPLILGYKKIKVILIYSVVTTAVLYFSFIKIFLIRLPAGILF